MSWKDLALGHSDVITHDARVDLFAAHAAPSKRFDVLADDFKFALLILLVSGLALALVLVRHAVKKKKLESAWA